MTDYSKRQLKALDRISKKTSDAESHLAKIEDSVPDKRHLVPHNMKLLRTSSLF
ncbi:hypothetical protein IMAU30156_00340 [Lactobacillus helveticus]|nr:hypothetical protein [Lactobacillus helveticus]NRN92928.1 hypothetical protein [Lactobacillus helveticus]NRO53891.1 hypothetical protein [Lactobacillus helveticus]